MDSYVHQVCPSIISEDSLLLYADDIAAAFTDQQQCSRIIQATKKWAENNNMKLNLNKSGLL